MQGAALHFHAVFDSKIGTSRFVEIRGSFHLTSFLCASFWSRTSKRYALLAANRWVYKVILWHSWDYSFLCLSMPFHAIEPENTSKYVLCGKKGSTLSKDTIGIYIIIKGLPSQITSRTSVFWINCAMISGFCRPDEEENISFFCWWQGWCSFYALFYLLLYVFSSDPSFSREKQLQAPCPGNVYVSDDLLIPFHLKKSPRFTSFRSDSDPGVTAGTIIHNSFLEFRSQFSPDFPAFFKSCGTQQHESY